MGTLRWLLAEVVRLVFFLLTGVYDDERPCVPRVDPGDAGFRDEPPAPNGPPR